MVKSYLGQVEFPNMSTITTSASNGMAVTVHKGWSRMPQSNDNQRYRPTTKCYSLGRSKPFSSISGRRISAMQPCDSHVPRTIQETVASTPQARGRQVEFVNATLIAPSRTPATRKLVKSHVMKEVSRTRQEQKHAKNKHANGFCGVRQVPSNQDLLASANENKYLYCGISTSSPIGIASNPYELTKQVNYHFDAFPTEAAPYMTGLLTVFFRQFASAMFPLELNLTYNPILTVSIMEQTMNDDACFHAILFSAAISAGLYQGKSDTVEIASHMNKTIGIVNERLGDVTIDTSLGILGAVSCLAFGEVRRSLIPFSQQYFQTC